MDIIGRSNLLLTSGSYRVNGVFLSHIVVTEVECLIAVGPKTWCYLCTVHTDFLDSYVKLISCLTVY